ncbi:hypothetical protein REPUB_Repub10bG0054000 [Reevesia pubescens]
MVQRCGLNNVHSQGNSFTWSGIRDVVLIKEKLDRALTCGERNWEDALESVPRLVTMEDNISLVRKIVGVKVHDSIERFKFRCSIAVCNALIDMYAKCGSLDKAWSVFNGMANRDVVSWNAMLQGFAMHGRGREALHVFSRMKKEGFQPDRFTFVSVLRWRRLKEAFRLLRTIPFEPNAIIWGKILGACRLHDTVELAEEVIDHLLKLDPSDPGNYSMLANIFATAGDWDSAAIVRLQMKSIGVKKMSGASSIEIDNEVHEFTVFDRSHPKFDRIYQMIDRLSQDLKRVVHPKDTTLPVEVVEVVI